MRAILVLAIVPMLIGLVASLLVREPKLASLLALAGSIGFVLLATSGSDADLAMGTVAVLLVSPLPIAISIPSVVIVAGRTRRPRRKREAS